VTLQFSEVIAELIQPVSAGGEMECSEYGLVDVLGGPAANRIAAVQEDFHQADDAGFMDFDAGIADRSDGDW